MFQLHNRINVAENTSSSQIRAIQVVNELWLSSCLHKSTSKSVPQTLHESLLTYRLRIKRNFSRLCLECKFSFLHLINSAHDFICREIFSNSLTTAFHLMLLEGLINEMISHLFLFHLARFYHREYGTRITSISWVKEFYGDCGFKFKSRKKALWKVFHLTAVLNEYFFLAGISSCCVKRVGLVRLAVCCY